MPLFIVITFSHQSASPVAVRVVQQAANVYYPAVNLYFTVCHIPLAYICITLWLLQTCLPVPALGLRAAPVTLCPVKLSWVLDGSNCSRRLPAFNLCWQAAFPKQLAHPGSRFHGTAVLEQRNSITAQHLCVRECVRLCVCVCVSYQPSVSLSLYVWAWVYINQSMCVVCTCVWSVFPKGVRQTLRHGPGLILMQAHGAGLRLGDNCCSEEWMAWELSSSTGASQPSCPSYRTD